MDTCVICLDEINQNPVKISCDCNLEYHRKCIDEALNYNNKCPQCRKENVYITTELDNKSIQIWREDVPYDFLDYKKLELRTRISYSNIYHLSANQLPHLKILLSLPKHLVTLEIVNCGIKRLPYSLPHTLRNIWCWNNSIAVIESLPKKLEKIDCSDNPIELMPDNVPNSLKEFYARNVRIDVLPLNMEICDIVIIGNY